VVPLPGAHCPRSDDRTTRKNRGEAENQARNRERPVDRIIAPGGLHTEIDGDQAEGKSQDQRQAGEVGIEEIRERTEAVEKLTAEADQAGARQPQDHTPQCAAGERFGARLACSHFGRVGVFHGAVLPVPALDALSGV
jgi:hypothetical protein